MTTLVMGVLNVTPDSFSDGGCFSSLPAAVEHGLLMHSQGADWVDVGGESTRPGALRVSPAEEAARVVPVVRALAAQGVAVSVDTVRASVARAAVEAGARCVNDVSGGTDDPGMLAVVAAAGVPYVCMHHRGPSVDMAKRAVYDDVVADVLAELALRRDAALAAGVLPANLVLDPGLGFAKTAEQSWDLLAALPRLVASAGAPLLVGASRKSFLGTLLGTAGAPRPVGGREAATEAVTTVAAMAGAWGVRVHEVPAAVDAVTVVARLRR